MKGTANSMLNRSKEKSDVKTLVLCIGDGGVEVMDRIAGEQDTGRVKWYGWNTDFGEVSEFAPEDIKDRQREAEQGAKNMLDEHKSIQYVLILAKMDGKASTYLIPMIAKVFRKHRVQVLCVVTTGFCDFTAQQQRSINKATEKLRLQSALFLSVQPQETILTSEELLWQISRHIISGLDSKEI